MNLFYSQEAFLSTELSALKERNSHLAVENETLTKNIEDLQEKLKKQVNLFRILHLLCNKNAHYQILNELAYSFKTRVINKKNLLLFTI